MTKLGFRTKTRSLKYEIELLHRCAVKAIEDTLKYHK